MSTDEDIGTVNLDRAREVAKRLRMSGDSEAHALISMLVDGMSDFDKLNPEASGSVTGISQRRATWIAELQQSANELQSQLIEQEIKTQQRDASIAELEDYRRKYEEEVILHCQCDGKLQKMRQAAEIFRDFGSFSHITDHQHHEHDREQLTLARQLMEDSASV